MPTPITFSFAFPASLTGSAVVDSLIAGKYWLGSTWPLGGTTSLSYSFMAPGTSYFATNYSPKNEYNALYELTSAQKTAITSALGAWSAVANLTFTLTSDNINNVGDLRFGGYRLMDNKTAAWAYFPDNLPAAGDVWVGTETSDPNPGKGTYDYMTFVHEIGHALGLKHPFDTSATNKTLLDPSLDDVHFTVMSYNSNYSYQPTTPMVLDIIAMQSLYGANMLWQTGDNSYKWDANQSVFETIWDAGGNDTIDGSNQLTFVDINLNEGTYSTIGKAFTDLNNNTQINDGLAIAFGAKIENAIGSVFNDTLTGNALNNVLNGIEGADTMDGGAGNDTYYVDNIGDVVIERGTSASEIDLVNAAISYTLGANVENLTLLYGGNINATGNELNNTLTGNSGDNILDGGAGIDRMIGGAGNDTYIVDNSGDVIVETSTLASEIDTVRSSINWVLGANLENLTLTGTGNIAGYGNALDNVIIGNDGNNELSGQGGLDTLIGGKGDDAYLVDQIGELALVKELANEGTDTLYVTYAATAQTNTVDLSTSNLQNFENVTLLGAGQFNIIGNDLNNTLLGNADANTLNGGAGDDLLDGRAGADTLIGGTGNDTYIVDNSSDVIVETSTLANEIDTVRSSVNWVLGANLENLTLTGTGNLAGYGNALDNVIIGNDGNNELSGQGGLDTLIGGKGNDAYLVDQIGELALVKELANEGTDTIYITYTSTAQTNTVDLSTSNLLNFENVTLLGAGQFNVIGNASNNTLTGNSGDNILDGGAGIDRMIGGAGNDTYIVDNSGDVIVETSTLASEIDTVRSSINWVLGANLENLTLTGTGNIAGYGNALDNVIIGNDGNNELSGQGGLDTLIGGKGDDAYLVDQIGELALVKELANEGTDTLYVTYAATAQTNTVDLSTSNLQNFENVTLLGAGQFNIIGNDLNNTLLGNADANTLNGGAGADTMKGGAGNDTYYVDNAGDVIVETSASLDEIDTVMSTLSYFLGTNLENLTLLGTANINGTGNERNNVITGNSGDNILDGGTGIDRMIGGTGNDTYIVDNSGDVIVETSTLANEIDTVRSSVNWVLGANLENLTLTGTGNLAGYGNALDNVIIGNDGNNELSGQGGLDTLIGGKGNDAYLVDQIGELALVKELANEGTDTIYITYTSTAQTNTVDLSTSNLLNFENVTLLGAGQFNVIGNASNNTLTGNSGDNVLDGGAGIDRMIGGAGNDTYIVDNSGDVIVETSTLASEIDTVRSSINWVLGANLENLTLTGTGNIAGYGNALDNVIIGNDGNNELSGQGGLDTLIGGKGDDAYLVDQIGELALVKELANEGTDTLYVTYAATAQTNTVDLSTSNLQNFENVTLLGAGQFNIIGNDLNNTLLGNADANTLNGGAGDDLLDGRAGADTLIGGTGNDTYIVDNSSDVIVETSTLANEIDTVRSSVNWVLGANLENLTLTGTGNLAGYGNALDNVIIGNDGNNELSGQGGLDTLIGGKGNDAYLVDQIGELALVKELANEGTDTIYITYTSTAQTNTVDLSTSNLLNFENVTLLGAGQFNLIGNASNNTLIGNSSNNTLDGGLGTDTFTGGAGADIFRFSALNDMGKDSSRDVITDFNSLQGDKIDLKLIDANLLQNGLNGFTFIGSNEFSGAGQLRFVDHVLSGNVSGNSGADFEIQLVGVNSFSANDLLA
ncbi:MULTISPECIES: matrixin family metalloprotease [unclassified Pseudomonas]|uniref:matrixin family metalloprotease n=1 Tax=unclassified Pseudomonas TaxID=196821 RepID=UPI002A36F62D|nr:MULTISPECIES: matrixin family metalloprotease [unclassified Pseudomonas]MDX9670946.1 calcium-binding protein [Pseudomonas sp. P8_250]WPN35067.1 calcium-binding protein [Pseudomonas sp. P8_139]WPN43133.1 calcium-binding protein [Pseudomonas sp. P8_229]